MGLVLRELIGPILWNRALEWQRELTRALRDLDLSHRQFLVLYDIGELGKSCDCVTAAMLCEVSGSDPMTMSKVVRELERRCLLERGPHPDDARAYSLEVTADGCALVAEAFRRARELDAELFGDWSTEVIAALTLCKPR